MENWTAYLPLKGSKISSPVMPGDGMAMDKLIETHGLDSSVLTGQIDGNDVTIVNIPVSGISGPINAGQLIGDIDGNILNVKNLIATRLISGKVQTADLKTYFDIDNNREIVNDGTDDRVLIGYLLNGFGTGKNYGVRISQEGYDVKTCSDNQLIMSSAFNLMKIVDTAATTLVAPAIGATATKTIAHGLSYIPTALVYVDYGAAFRAQLPYFGKKRFNSDGETIGIESYLYFEVDATNLKIYIMNGNDAAMVGETVNIKYYLFRETAN